MNTTRTRLAGLLLVLTLFAAAAPACGSAAPHRPLCHGPVCGG
jgi:hypothetical protein